jgi:hypothetical protein
MRVTINNRPAAGLSDDQEKDVRLAPVWAVVQGSILDSAAAASRVLFRWRAICICFVVLVWLVLVALAILPQSGDRDVLREFALVMAGLTPLGLWLVYFVKRGRLYASLPERSRASPPTGTPIRIDGAGLTIGNRSAAWNEVVVDRVDYSLVTGRHAYRAYYVSRLHLRLNDVPFVLDKSLLDEGVAIVDGIYRHKFSKSRAHLETTGSA